MYIENINYNWKGLILKKNNERYKYINPEYKKIKDLAINSNNPLYIYIYLIKNQKLQKYLRTNNEYKKNFKHYYQCLNILKDELFNNYKDIYIFKNKKISNCPYQLRPLLHGLHNQYLITNYQTTYKTVHKYVYNLPINRLIFPLKYYIKE